jgi:uncharacterized membrane protein
MFLETIVDMEKRKKYMSNEKAAAKKETRTDVKALTVTAIFIALIYVFTAFTSVRIPLAGNGGMIHLGNIPLLICAIIFGKKMGAIAGAVGMGLFDILSGWLIWAPFTVIIVGLLGFSVGAITEKHHGVVGRIAFVIVACAIEISGYYIAEGILYGNWIAPVTAVPVNLVQVLIPAIMVLFVVKHLDLAARKAGLK